MFCCVKYGLDGEDSSFINLNCGTAALRDFVTERALKQLGNDFVKQRDLQRKHIALLTKQITAHTKQVQNLQKRQAESPTKGPAEDEGGDQGGGEDGEGNEAEPVEQVSGKDSLETVSRWIEAAEAEIREREAVLIALSEGETAFQDVTTIDLRDPVSGTRVNLSQFPVHMPASAILPLRSTTELVGVRGEDQEVLRLSFSIPRVERDAAVLDMLEYGVLAKGR
ncbi:unnamed protein product [Amoebophrya sp. A25]|nr:unnamed protein product [Amoebophrya sp. A25]|eukprot:GSA25T00000901001.1